MNMQDRAEAIAAVARLEVLLREALSQLAELQQCVAAEAERSRPARREQDRRSPDGV